MTVEQETSVMYERRWWTLAVLCLSLVMIVVANVSLNVALPTLARDLHAGSSALQWVVDSYSLVFAGLLLTAGALGDRYGRRLALNVGLLIFGGASGLASIAASAGQLIAARALMGVGAALVMPATLSVLAHVFPPEERRRAIAIWAGFAGVGGGLGGVTSGWLLQHFSWGSIFFSNVALVAVALVAGAFLIPASRDEHKPALDPVGALLSIGGLGALIYAIIEAPGRGWTSAGTVVAFAAAAGLLVAFGRWELRADEPMLDLRFFRDPRFTAASSTITLMFFVMFGMTFVLTQYLQAVLGYSTLQAGIRILPWAIVYMLAAPRSAPLVERFGQRAVVAGGLVVVSGGLTILALSGVHANYPLLAVSLVVTAIGMGMVTAPSTGAIMASLPLNKAGVGSAVNDTSRELGGALGVAVVGSIVSSLYRSGLTNRIGTLPATARDAGSSLGVALRDAANAPGPAGRALAGAARAAYVHAFDVAMVFTVVVALAASGLVWWVLRPAAVEAVEYEEAEPIALEAA
jgi:MFS transporter, DHA2 family, integral membrane protein